ncbi:MAG: hypothetical protein OEV81_06520 [Betaproteobacteria bacterium]|nr:hypothetical protein [Betaproteobacteria bacterium]MDH5222584.1 hypothetical protein [Betaproteobacteria bacterium]MDH5350893.1 hypothetical protein [Betaproteobacteria bacterium]
MPAIGPRHVLALAAAFVGGSALAQEKPYEIKVCSTTEVTVIDRAGETTILASVSRGIADSVKPGGAFDKTTFECRGVTNASKAGLDYNSRCTFVDADGDRVVGATAGHAKGWNWKFLGGTGKWEGIEGGGTGKSTGAYPRLSPAVSAGCGLATGTYSFKK